MMITLGRLLTFFYGASLTAATIMVYAADRKPAWLAAHYLVTTPLGTALFITAAVLGVVQNHRTSVR